jgi:SAM-dependent methyltransferase
MLDVGTGSGILAIYAAKLGARRVLAIDTDPEALRWAQRNLDLNHASRFIELTSKSVAELSDVFSILVANLTRDALMELLPDFERLLEKNGTMILSVFKAIQDVKNHLHLNTDARLSLRQVGGIAGRDGTLNNGQKPKKGLVFGIWASSIPYPNIPRRFMRRFSLMKSEAPKALLATALRLSL